MSEIKLDMIYISDLTNLDHTNHKYLESKAKAVCTHMIVISCVSTIMRSKYCFQMFCYFVQCETIFHNDAKCKRSHATCSCMNVQA